MWRACVLACLISCRAAQEATRFDVMVDVAGRIDEEVRRQKGQDHHGLPALSGMLSMVPKAAREEFNTMTLEHGLQESLLSAATHDEAIAHAVSRVDAYMNANKKGVATFVHCLAVNHTGQSAAEPAPANTSAPGGGDAAPTQCDLYDALSALLTAFGEAHGWHDPPPTASAAATAALAGRAAAPAHAGHGTRPAAPSSSDGVVAGGNYDGGYENLQSILLKTMLWLSLTLVNVLQLSTIPQRYGLTKISSTAYMADEEITKEQEDKWLIMTSVFPNYEAYKNANADNKELDTIITDLCKGFIKDVQGGETLDQEGEMQDAEAAEDDRRAECWETWARKLAPGRASVLHSVVQLPLGLAAFFGLILLARDGVLADTCSSTLQTDGEYHCSNGNYLNSLCVLSCHDEYDIDGTLRVRRSIDRSKSNVMVCGRDGQWYGGPETCSSFYDPNGLARDTILLAGTDESR